MYFAGRWALLYRARYSIKLTLELRSKILHGFRFSPDIKVLLQATPPQKKKKHTCSKTTSTTAQSSNMFSHLFPCSSPPLFGTLACPSKRRAAESTGAALRCCLSVVPSDVALVYYPANLIFRLQRSLRRPRNLLKTAHGSPTCFPPGTWWKRGAEIPRF